MKLSKTQREVLEQLRNDDSGNLMVECDGEVYVGTRRRSNRLLHALLSRCAITGEEIGDSTYYSINETGKRALDEPNFELPDELRMHQRD